jgi:hypothetical protein
MSEDDSLRKGENRIYRLIDRGPIFLGLPFMHAAAVAGATGFGYWPAKMMGGNMIGILWILFGIGSWAILGFLNSQDKTYLPRLFLKYSGIVMKESITSYEASNQNIEVK